MGDITKSLLFGCFVLGMGLIQVRADEKIELPDTSMISGQLTASFAIDRFFSLWLVFNNADITLSDKPYTIFTPRNSAELDPAILNNPKLVSQILQDHVVIGQKITMASGKFPQTFKAISGKTIKIAFFDREPYANKVRIYKHDVDLPKNGTFIVIQDYMVDKDIQISKKSDKNVALLTTMTAEGPVEEKSLPKVNDRAQNGTFVENVSQVLSFLKSGARVFQHFLGRSNVSQLIKEGQQYTVFVPTDIAFQRWHPIDWGFYPFSVPEFTESIMINHFVIGNLRQGDIKDGQTAETLGGREISFSKTPILTVNGASMVIGDTPIPNGNMMFISEVLFVSESVVSRLHQQHRDKETPPLLAFPWFGAQFLSHSFLALERDKRFTHITRFLNLADLAPHVSGAGYTFFVPTDEAFDSVGLNLQPDKYLATGEGLKMLLNHFVKGRLYDRDLKDGVELTTLGNETIHVRRTPGNVTVNDASIVETEVFVYNLGTMFYIDKILFPTPEIIALKPTKNSVTNIENNNVIPTTEIYANTIPEGEQLTTLDVEKIPSEWSEEVGTLPDVLLEKSTDQEPLQTRSPNVKKVGNSSVSF